MGCLKVVWNYYCFYLNILGCDIRNPRKLEIPVKMQLDHLKENIYLAISVRLPISIHC